MTSMSNEMDDGLRFGFRGVVLSLFAAVFVVSAALIHMSDVDVSFAMLSSKQGVYHLAESVWQTVLTLSHQSILNLFTIFIGFPTAGFNTGLVISDIKQKRKQLRT